MKAAKSTLCNSKEKNMICILGSMTSLYSQYFLSKALKLNSLMFFDEQTIVLCFLLNDENVTNINKLFNIYYTINI